jgi:cytidylate kinase
MDISNTLQIAIDGPAGAGKSTVAREVARRLGILYLDTGAMYRAITWKALQLETDLYDREALTQLTQATSVSFDENNQNVYCDDEDVTEAIRTPHVAKYVSAVSAVPGVRAHLTSLQRQIAGSRSIVLDGRDIGSYVLPDAPVKVFLTADLIERAQRRHKDLIHQGQTIDLSQVAEKIETRDKFDSSRETSPLRQAEDAVLIDTSTMTVDEVVEKILELTNLVKRRAEQ